MTIGRRRSFAIYDNNDRAPHYSGFDANSHRRLDPITGSTTSTTDESWRKRAGCLTVDPDIFFTAQGRREAKNTCAVCPVAAECLMFEMRAEAEVPRDDRDGIFGGITPFERWRIQNEVSAQTSTEAEFLTKLAERVKRRVARLKVVSGPPSADRKLPPRKADLTDLRARALELVDGGLSASKAAERLGVTTRSVQRWNAARHQESTAA